MVYYRKIIKTTTYAGKSFYAYIIEENKDDKTKDLQDKIKEFVDNHPNTQKLYDKVTFGIDQEFEIVDLIDLDLDELGNRIFQDVGIE